MSPLDWEVHTPYVDPGATAVDNVDGDLTSEVTINADDVRTDVLGDYEVIVTVSDTAGNVTTKTRTVHVVDTTKPVLTLTGDDPLVIEVGSEYDEPGYTAMDNYDGNMTDQVEISGDVDAGKIGDYIVTYSVTDSSGNQTVEERTVNVIDTTAPVITLKGDNPLVINFGSKFAEPGFTVRDNSGKTYTAKCRSRAVSMNSHSTHIR